MTQCITQSKCNISDACNFIHTTLLFLLSVRHLRQLSAVCSAQLPSVAPVTHLQYFYKTFISLIKGLVCLSTMQGVYNIIFQKFKILGGVSKSMNNNPCIEIDCTMNGENNYYCV